MSTGDSPFVSGLTQRDCPHLTHYDTGAIYMNNMRDILKKYFIDDDLDKIENTHLFIAGCGGLGSNIAHMLVRSGFVKFTLLDHDTVEESNLNRQFYFPDQVGLKKTQALADNLTRLNPQLELTLINGRLESSYEVAALTEDCDILVEAFDSPESKAVFVSGAVPTGKPVISASGIAGYGNTDDIIVRKRGANLYLVGDGKSDVSDMPPLSRSGTCDYAGVMRRCVNGDGWHTNPSHSTSQFKRNTL